MSQSWDIDPQKRDYFLDGSGKPAETDSLRVPAYFRLKTRRRGWLYAPDTSFGSLLHLITRRSTTQNNTVVEDSAADALQPILDDGRAVQITVDANEKSRSGVGLTATIVDAGGNEETLAIQSLGV